jgi:excisionase family DNA binding protein
MTVLQDSPLLTVRETADRLRVSPQLVYRRIETGELQAVRLGHGPKAPIRITAVDLDRFLRPERREPPPG